jgi:protein KRI1
LSQKVLDYDLGCLPPPDEQIQGYLGNVFYCTKCSCKLDGSQLYFKSKEIEDYLLCETCMYFSKKKKNKKAFDQIKPTKVSISNVLEKEDYHKLQGSVADSELSKLVDEYYNIDFEDVIAGGLKTRFKYVPVEKQDFNLDDDDLVFADEKLLNRYLSIKKLAPYKEDAYSVFT